MTLLNQSESSVAKTVQSRFLDGREYHADPRSAYVLAKDDIEKKRLREQHIWLRENFQLLLQPQILAPLFEKEIDVYDIGCGTASWILDMAVEYPNAQYYGADMTDMFPQSDIPENCHFAIGNVLEDNPFGKKFDFIQMRYFVVALREKEWDEAYLNIYNQLKPGGYFQVVEPGTRMNTTNSELNEINIALRSFLKSKGQYPHVAPKVIGMMKASGFNIVYDRMIEVPIGWGNTNCVQGAEGMRAMYTSIASGLADQLNITVEDCKAKINRACDSMGPTETTACQWSFLAQKPFECNESNSA